MSMVEATLPMDVERIRADFPILQTKVHGDKPLVYLDNAATTQRPRQVIDALVETYEKHYANVDPALRKAIGLTTVRLPKKAGGDTR